ncbi:DUF2971 domain-containing protein [Cognatilysobacter lacus]|uniref:DUF2971 domain-containing protein n=1 Tax=Cognatilysobacter lacus TaxID=1643323 RepID=UPI001960F0C7|nr:DUF2971 domain-containing protein [Lysobacter lacus]
MNEEFGLKDLREKRLKISRVAQLNDPFELLAVDLAKAENRKLIKAWKGTFGNRHGLVCFSRSWRNPVQWSHYADKHKGICLGFDVADHLPRQVAYVTSRFNWPIEIDEIFSGQLLFTKFAHWSYEDEFRIFTTLEDPEDDLHYMNFSNDLVLRQVIVGSESSITRSAVADALGPSLTGVEVFKARPPFRSFRVVRNKDASLWA